MQYENVRYTAPDFEVNALKAAPDAQTEPAPADGLVPITFYAATNYPTYVKRGGAWTLAKKQRMDAALIWDAANNVFIATEPRRVKAGQEVVVGQVEDGSAGVLAHSSGFLSSETAEVDAFGFMSTGPSRERPLNYKRLARLIQSNRNPAGRILWVLGPAVVHSGARDAMAWLINNGYAWVLFGGNAVAAHDIERSVYGTALGMDIEGLSVRGGHRHHVDAINRVRISGSIKAAVEDGTIREGIMYSAIKAAVPFVLAGSIRDDGPLPDVITDAIQAQDAMRVYTQDATLVVMLATMLHSIATGNMMPTFIEDNDALRPVYTIAVDQDEIVLNKLIDRGSHQSVGVVRNADDFLVRLVYELQQLENGA